MTALTATAAMALAGGLGALARVEVATFLSSRAKQPWATRAVNIVGTVLLAVLLTTDASPRTVQVLGTGFLGGFTTFSTWMLETAAHDRPQNAMVEIALPLGLGLGLAALIRSVA